MLQETEQKTTHTTTTSSDRSGRRGGIPTPPMDSSDRKVVGIGVMEEEGGGRRSCIECRTTSTPMWRGGPSGPRSLCNACGIRYRKRRRQEVGLGQKQGGDRKDAKAGAEEEEDDDSKLQVVKKRRVVMGVEEAAFLLMALSSSSAAAFLHG